MTSKDSIRFFIWNVLIFAFSHKTNGESQNSTNTVFGSKDVTNTPNYYTEQFETQSNESNIYDSMIYPNQTVNSWTKNDAEFPEIILSQGVYSWNKTEMSAKDFQQSFCPRRCNNGKIEKMHSLCFDVDCFKCECERPQCEIYGICCPDISEPFFTPPNLEYFKIVNNNKNAEDSSEDYTSQGNYKSKLFNTTDITSLEFTTFSVLPTELVKTTLEFSSLKDFTETKDSRVEFTTKKAFTESVDTLWPTSFTQVSTELSTSQSLVDNLNLVYTRHRDNKRPPKLECDENNNVLTIKSCSKDVQVLPEVIQKCESGVPKEEITSDSFAFVSDGLTKVVYYNKYCAECNAVTKTKKWEVNVYCLTYIRVYKATTEDELLRQSLLPDSRCSVEQRPQGVPPLFSCYDKWCSVEVIDTCNVTGLWRDYDEDVVTGCATLTEEIYKVTVKLLRYQYFKNIFCAICNKAEYPIINLCYKEPELQSGTQPNEPPLTVLFGFKKSKAPIGVCNASEWQSPSGSCIPLECFPGKVLLNGDCTTALPEITGLGYKINLWYVLDLENKTSETFTIDTPPSSVIFSRFFSQLLAVLDPLIVNSKLSIGAVVNITGMEELFENQPFVSIMDPSITENHYYNDDDFASNSSTQATIANTTESQYLFNIPRLFWINGFVVADRGTYRDDFEKLAVDQLLYGQIKVNFAHSVNVNFNPVVMWEVADAVRYCSSIAQYDSNMICYNGTTVINTESITNIQDLFLNLTNVLTCTFVTVKRSHYMIENFVQNFLPKFVVTLNIDKFKLVFKDSSELGKMAKNEHGDLQVCSDLVTEKVKSLNLDKSVVSVMKAAQYVLTLLCMGVSMVCLLLALATYIKFPVLRSVAGKNNMGLSVSLLLSQTLLLASFHTSLNSVMCAPLGIATHYLWLCMFSWSFLCCFYMYKVFGAKTRSSITSHRSQSLLLVKSITFSVLAPAVVVVVVVVAVYTTSGGKDFGYGGSACYLNSDLLVGAAMIGPLIVMVTSNTIFFLITVMNIHRVRRLKKQSTMKADDRQNLYVYIKLSSVTGSFWIVTIMAETLEVDGLRILAICLNGLQGVFIFVSYICNKRILNLYLQSIGRQIPETSKTASISVKSTRQKHSPKTLE